MTSVIEAVPHKSSSSSPYLLPSSSSLAQPWWSLSTAQLSSSQVLDLSMALVIQQMVLKHSVNEVKFPLAMREKMLTTDTSGQASFRTLAKKYGLYSSRLSQTITPKKTAGDKIPMKKRKAEKLSPDCSHKSKLKISLFQHPTSCNWRYN